MLSRRGGPERNPPNAGTAASSNPSDIVFLRVVFLRALITVYRPWITSMVVNEPERRRAAARVAAAQRELDKLAAPRRPDGTWTRPGHRS
ncbi:hypothetical protein [Thermomonospora cellulosilytica]|uniref:Uncharacterized protein n=1 Tax=Thermomonospora cellulosilytica TaxID=1411118 RepID=A0A7W3N471_9ACTN|nr:hypothetical protein [Thermomonospora cellulosilytica]MBA9007253.1 hypothetical protein [Thermomonospora cellulosilytica]